MKSIISASVSAMIVYGMEIIISLSHLWTPRRGVVSTRVVECTSRMTTYNQQKGSQRGGEVQTNYLGNNDMVTMNGYVSHTYVTSVVKVVEVVKVVKACSHASHHQCLLPRSSGFPDHRFRSLFFVFCFLFQNECRSYWYGYPISYIYIWRVEVGMPGAIGYSYTLFIKKKKCTTRW